MGGGRPNPDAGGGGGTTTLSSRIGFGSSGLLSMNPEGALEKKVLIPANILVGDDASFKSVVLTEVSNCAGGGKSRLELVPSPPTLPDPSKLLFLLEILPLFGGPIMLLLPPLPPAPIII